MSTSLLNTAGNYNVPKILNDEEVTVTRLIDLTSVTLGTADCLIFKIPKMCIVTGAYISVMTAAGAAVTCALKNITTSTEYISNADINSVNEVTAITARELVNEASDCDIAIALSASNTTAKFFVTIKYIPVSTSI